MSVFFCTQFYVGESEENMRIVLRNLTKDYEEICGEPNRRVTEKISCDNPFVRHEREADYKLLGRLKSDCDYFLGYGNAYEGYLYFMNIEKHCDEMEKLWKSFEDYDKPEWLTLEQINEYREKMLDKRRKTK